MGLHTRALRARHDDIVAEQRRNGNARDLFDAELLGEGHVLRGVGREDCPVVAHEVHLVDGQYQFPDAEHRADVGVPTRLRQQVPAAMDVAQNDRQVGRRRTGRHVARVLLVAGRVGDDELALVGREEAIGYVDRDALLPLGRQAIDEKGEIERAALRSDLALSVLRLSS